MIFAGFDENCKGIKMQIKNTHSVDAVSHPLDQAIVTPQHCCSVVPQSIHGLYMTQFGIFVFFELKEEFGCFEEEADYKKVKVSALFKMSSPLIT